MLSVDLSVVLVWTLGPFLLTIYCHLLRCSSLWFFVWTLGDDACCDFAARWMLPGAGRLLWSMSRTACARPSGRSTSGSPVCPGSANIAKLSHAISFKADLHLLHLWAYFNVWIISSWWNEKKLLTLFANLLHVRHIYLYYPYYLYFLFWVLAWLFCDIDICFVVIIWVCLLLLWFLYYRRCLKTFG